MPVDQDRRKHLIVSDTATSESFTSPTTGGGGPPNIPQRERAPHGQRLLGQLANLRQRSEQIYQEQEDIGLERGLGIRIHFEGAENVELPIESLARDAQGIELLNARADEHHIYATVFVPEGKLAHFERLLQQYLEEETSSGKPKNLKLISSIEQIREAAFDELWTDDNDVLPEDEAEVIDWEVWLPVRNDRLLVLEQFRQRAALLDLEVSNEILEFPERTVLAVRGTKQQITNSARLLDSIAEIRRVKETSDFFLEMPNIEQQEWVDDLLQRTDYPEGDAPFVTVLDTGVNNGHPLLEPVLADQDLHSVDPVWGADDADGHGSGMAGLAIYGDLANVLETADPVYVPHRLESVKLLRHSGDNAHRHHGDLTQEAIARVEVTAPLRQRVFCMAVTSKDNRDRGRPSAWSATIDNLASGAADDSSRLVIVSAGNVHRDNWPDYPDGNSTDSIHDPGQAWNALTVGAYTDKVTIQDDAPAYAPLAPVGGLSPHSTTSATWKSTWPLKPDVVFEGGNVADDGLGPVTMGSLELLTTYHQPQDNHFDYFNATSAAAALASKMAAGLNAAYSQLWPESIRALIVHSAQWTDAMREVYLPANPNTTHYETLIKHCGFGVPNTEKALWSASNSLTLVAQDRLQPFWKDGSSYKSKDMNLHSIPWPRDALLELGETEVTMRVTLSYFIEPNPSERGFSGRYGYASHGLRFDVRRADETEDDFRARINRAARDEEAGTRFGGDGGGWLLGKQKRHRGSLHSDIWIGTAADLANRHHIAVYPAIGWWRERHHLLRYTKSSRYSLIVSIETPETELDIYNEVFAQIEVPVEVGV